MAKVFLSGIVSLLLGLSFPTFAADPPKMTEVDVKKLAGTWYPVKAITPDPLPVRSFALTLEPVDAGKILAKVEIPMNGDCSVNETTMTKVSPGVFSSPMGQITIMDSDYKNYLFYEYSQGSARSLHLYARKKTVSKEVEQKFKSIVKSVGFKKEHDFELSKEGHTMNTRATRGLKSMAFIIQKLDSSIEKKGE